MAAMIPIMMAVASCSGGNRRAMAVRLMLPRA